METFDPKHGDWKVTTDMKFARRGCSSVVVGDFLYVVGGFDGESYIQEME